MSKNRIALGCARMHDNGGIFTDVYEEDGTVYIEFTVSRYETSVSTKITLPSEVSDQLSVLSSMITTLKNAEDVFLIKKLSQE